MGRGSLQSSGVFGLMIEIPEKITELSSFIAESSKVHVLYENDVHFANIKGNDYYNIHGELQVHCSTSRQLWRKDIDCVCTRVGNCTRFPSSDNHAQFRKKKKKKKKKKLQRLWSSHGNMILFYPCKIIFGQKRFTHLQGEFLLCISLIWWIE